MSFDIELFRVASEEHCHWFLSGIAENPVL